MRQFAGVVGGYGSAVDEHLSLVGLEETADASQEGGLAAPVGAHDGGDAPAGYVGADVVEDVA